MTDSETPWEPPLAGTEAEHVIGSLDRLRTTFRWKVDELDAAGLQTRIGASSLTLATLLKHLALVEDHASLTRVTGERLDEPWRRIDWDAYPDWPFDAPDDMTPDEVYTLYDDAVERARARFAAAIADGGLDQPIHLSDGEGHHASLRRLLCDLIEEYGRHTGHADLLREAVDGRVGEDPPRGWRPRSPSSRAATA